jgi:hypothetical protein
MIFDNQSLRNLTTGRIHTKMDEIYKGLEAITGEKGLMTHMLPRALTAVTPWLKKHVTDPRFWNGQHDPAHVGTTELPEPTSREREQMFAIYMSLPNPLTGKTVIAVEV